MIQLTLKYKKQNRMKLSSSLFAVALAQYDYDDFMTEEVQTTPLYFDPSVSFNNCEKI